MDHQHIRRIIRRHIIRQNIIRQDIIRRRIMPPDITVLRRINIIMNNIIIGIKPMMSIL